MENENQPKEKENKYLPVAVVIAGLVIAGAIYLRPASPVSPGAQVAAPAGFDIATLPALAAEQNVNERDFATCTASGKYDKLIEAQSNDAVKLGAQGTPFSVIITKSGKTYTLPGAMGVAEIKPLIEAALADQLPADPNGPLPAPLPPISATDHLNGSANAPVKIVEYSDLQCPFCKIFHQTMEQVMQDYGAKGQVAWVYRQFPLTSIHPTAKAQSVASECVAELAGNDAFWRFISKLFAAH